MLQFNCKDKKQKPDDENKKISPGKVQNQEGTEQKGV